MRNSGFTLIELLVSIVIIGILVSIMVPGLLVFQKRSYDIGSKMCAKSIQTAEAISYVDRKEFINTYSDIEILQSLFKDLDKSCKNTNIFYKDRSRNALPPLSYEFDVWDRRGSAVITVTQDSLSIKSTGATPFSSDSSGGINFP